MKTALKITERDENYVKQLTDTLICQGYEVNDGIFYVPSEETAQDMVNSIHGVALYDPNEKPFAEKNADVVQWLNNYKGTFEFYLSVKQQYERKGFLSDKQVEAIRRAVVRDKQQSAPVETTVSPAHNTEFSLKSGTLILVTKKIAKELAAKAGLVRPHYLFEVVTVHNETAKAFRCVFKLSAQRTSHCAICGLALTDPRSVATGIGPICCSKLGIPQDERALDELRKQLEVTTTVESWIPKYAIKTEFKSES